MKKMRHLNLTLLILVLISTSLLGQQIVINEVMVRPPGTTSTPPNGLIYNNSEEYIELYNNSCNTVNIAGYFIAMKQSLSGTNSGGTIRIPNVPAATIPPGGHVVIGSSNPAGSAIGNIDIPLTISTSSATATDYCMYNGNFVLANSDGWCALYNASGVAQSCIYWSSNAANLTSGSFASDFNPSSICIPTGAPTVTLQTPVQINSSNPSIISYGGANPSAGNPISRITDGASVLTQTLTPSIGANNCNGGSCNSVSSFSISASVTNPSCATSNGSITITPNPTGVYTYTWTSPAVSTTNIATGLQAGTYTIIVGQGGCTTNTIITLTSAGAPTITATQVASASCGNNNGSATITATTADSYTWSSGVTSTTNTASNLAPGNYTVTLGLAGCITNTTVTIGSVGGPTITSTQTIAASCGNNDGTATITATSADSYTWSSGVSSTTNTASNLAPGNYTVTIGLAGCCINTIITIPSQTCCPSSLTYSLAVSGNTVCNGISIPCNYSGPSILINEIALFPTSNDGSIYGETSLIGKEGEWIELFNPDWCNSVDISGYILGSYNSTGSASVPASNGMAFVLPAGTIVPPLGFVIVRGRNAPVPPAGVLDVIVDNIAGRLCIDGGVNTSRLWFQNAGGWFAFYNSNGIPQDMVRWGNPSPSDLNGNPCIPSTNSLPPGFTQLPSATQAGTIVTALGNPTQGNTFVRIPDGATWSSNGTSLNTYGTCNVQGGCVNPGSGSSTCSGQAAVFMTNGQAPYTYLWSTSPTQTTQTASSLCGGNYTVTVKDANLCEEIITLSVSTVVQPTITSVSSSSATCSQSNGSASVSAVPSTATYSWSGGINSTSNIANNIPAGTYTITVSESPCITSSVVVVAGSVLDITVTNSSTATSCLNNDGNIFITSSNGIAEPFSYSLNGLNFTTDTIFSGLSSGIYTITVVDNINCSITQTISVSSADTKPEVIVPNIFTPNNDLKNDVWYVNSICINEFKLTIFNRWGNKIIEFNNPAEKWDGSGANDGTYYYVLEAKGYNNEQINKTGFITITR